MGVNIEGMGKGCVDNITIRNISLDHPSLAGIEIKTEHGDDNESFVSNVLYEDIVFKKSMNASCCPCVSITAAYGKPGAYIGKHLPQIFNVTYRNIDARGRSNPVTLQCDESTPCENIVFDSVQTNSDFVVNNTECSASDVAPGNATGCQPCGDVGSLPRKTDDRLAPTNALLRYTGRFLPVPAQATAAATGHLAFDHPGTEIRLRVIGAVAVSVELLQQHSPPQKVGHNTYAEFQPDYFVVLVNGTVTAANGGGAVSLEGGVFAPCFRMPLTVDTKFNSASVVGGVGPSWFCKCNVLHCSLQQHNVRRQAAPPPKQSAAPRRNSKCGSVYSFWSLLTQLCVCVQSDHDPGSGRSGPCRCARRPDLVGHQLSFSTFRCVFIAECLICILPFVR